MSSTLQKVARPLPSFTGFGNRPALTPAHQQVLLTGIIGGIGGFALGSPMICAKRRNPVSGSWFIANASFMFMTLLFSNGLDSKAKKLGRFFLVEFLCLFATLVSRRKKR